MGGFIIEDQSGDGLLEQPRWGSLQIDAPDALARYRKPWPYLYATGTSGFGWEHE